MAIFGINYTVPSMTWEERQRQEMKWRRTQRRRARRANRPPG